MRLWGVSMVRNEEDIVEAFVRHNLTVLDGMIVVDHGSADRTLAILNALCAERLRLVVLRSDAVGYLQAEITTTAARDAFARGGADAVFPLDADEFLRVASREALERELAAIPPGHHGRVAWPTFVPPLDGTARDIVASLRASRRVRPAIDAPPDLACKIVLTQSFASDPAATVTMGNHGVILGRHQVNSPRMPHVELPADVVEICHVPVRSAVQFVVKTTIKRLARIAAGRDYAPGGMIRLAFDAIRDGAPLTAARMLATHVGAVVPEASGASGPAEPPFVAPIALRYTPAVPADPLPLVVSAVEQLARRAAATPAARAGS